MKYRSAYTKNMKMFINLFNEQNYWFVGGVEVKERYKAGLKDSRGQGVKLKNMRTPACRQAGLNPGPLESLNPSLII